MCTDRKITYLLCGHYERQCSICPKFQKKKASFRNKIFGHYKGVKYCRSVRRERLKLARRCKKCSMNVPDLAGDHVASAAQSSHHPHADDRVRESHHKDGKRRSKHSKHHGHEATATYYSARSPEHYRPSRTEAPASHSRSKPQARPPARYQSDDRPRKSHRRTSHGTSASHRPTRNATSDRSSRKSSTQEVHSQKRRKYADHEEGRGYGVHSGAADSPLIFEDTAAAAGPSRTLAQRAPVSRRYGLLFGGPNGPPPSFDLPPLPRERHAEAHGAKGKQPIGGQWQASETTSPMAAPPQPPPALYEVHLEAQKEAERAYRARRDAMTARANNDTHPHLPSELAGKASTSRDLKRKFLHNAAASIGIEMDDLHWRDTQSEASFVCSGARRIEQGAPPSRR